ncbi:MAG: CotH kinase family protein, partial [Bacteroidia bacterium]|nr:CotH kinase family protein [Bacteroidia bacterium]
EETTVVKARNFSSDPKMLPGKIDFKTYFINEEFSFPVFSIAADQLQDLANGNGEIRPIGSIEYFVDHELSSKSFGELNRHGQDSWVNPQRSLDWVSRDEMGYSKALQDELFSYSDRDEYQRFMLRASGDDNYPAINDEDHEGSAHIRDEYVHTLAHEGNMKLDLRAVERAIVFLNGDYWGLYSPRERPTDHDYTEYYYDQDKYNLQYLLTWGRTWAEYGGQQAFEDWFELRDFIMNNDMGIAEHYEYVKDNMQVLGLIDYMLINLNVVSSDWLNYNTGWWRGLDPDGDHKKWGYLLWDNDATFDFYINYSGVPNIQPDAEPCDIEEISEFMDEFFSFDNSFQIDSNFASQCFTIINGTSPYPNNDPIFLEVINELFGCCFYGWSDECQALYEEIEAFQNFDPNDCNAIQNGTCPYPATDSIFIETIKFDDYCCSGSWDITCEKTYQALSKGIYVDEQLYENVGQHEKIFLKLQDESEEFLQLYYSRQADLNNTIFSCENMWRTLDIMSSAIAPEMPRHIQRWGGSMSEWEGNIEEMRNFISQRCELLDDGLINCYQLEGPYDLTIEVFPPNVGEIELNTLDLDRFPWTGSYYGNMENKIEAKAINSNFEFVKWQSKSGNIVFPSFTDEKATIRLMTSDTLIAVFSDGTTSIDEVNDLVSFDAYPSPAINEINIDFQVEKRNVILIQMFDVNGKIVYSRYEKNVEPNTVKSLRIDLETQNVVPGLYNIVLSAANQDLITKKIIVLE